METLTKEQVHERCPKLKYLSNVVKLLSSCSRESCSAHMGLDRVQHRMFTHQDCIRVVPAVPQDPEPHGTAQDLRLELLVLRDLRICPVLGLDVRTIASPKTHTITIFK